MVFRQLLKMSICLLAASATAALAGKADVVGASATAQGAGLWRFDVTVKHADSGWDHYADNFEILTMQGKLIARRILYHPHETEQPFTRSISGVKIPAGQKRVRIRAHDKVHGYGGREMELEVAPE